MLKFNFIFPLIYAIAFTVNVMTNHLFDLGINRFTLFLYIANLFTLYTLSKIGGAIDKCLGL